MSQVSLLFALPTSAHITLNSHQFANVFSFMKAVPVTYLDTISAQQLLINPLRERNIEVHPTTVALALRLTGGSPYYMTILGQYLIDYLNKLPRLQLINDIVLRAVIDRIVDESAVYNFTYLKQELLQEEEFRILEKFVYFPRKSSNPKCRANSSPIRSICPYTRRENISTVYDRDLFLTKQHPTLTPITRSKLSLCAGGYYATVTFFTVSRSVLHRGA